jgi:hypothetical protein
VTLGDTEVVKQVESGSTLMAKSIVIEKLTTASKTDDLSDGDKKELEELKQEFVKLDSEFKKERSETVEKVMPLNIIETILLIFTFNDGRVLGGSAGTFSDEKVILENGAFSVTVPEILINKIELDKKPQNSKTRLTVIANDGKTYKGWKIERENEDYLLTEDDGSKTQLDKIQKIFIK